MTETFLGREFFAKAVVTGVEMFRKLLDQGQAGDNVGVLLSYNFV